MKNSRPTVAGEPNWSPTLAGVFRRPLELVTAMATSTKIAALATIANQPPKRERLRSSSARSPRYARAKMNRIITPPA